MMKDEKHLLILPASNVDWKSPLKRAIVPRIVFTFALGLSFGFTLATLVLSPYSNSDSARIIKSSVIGKSSFFQQETAVGDGVNISKTLKETFEVKLDLNSTFVNELLKSSEEVAARRLAQEVRILCLVLTMPHNHKDRAIHVRDTWGRHCNVIHFISTKNDPELPTTLVEIPPNRDMEWAKMEGGFKYIHGLRMSDFDWVVKADHETFIVVENLRTMLSRYSHNDPIYFELNYGVNDTSTGDNFNSYVLSKEAVNQLVTKGYINGGLSECNGEVHKKAKFGDCLKALKLKREGTRDSQNRRRSLPFDKGDLSDIKDLKGNWWEEDYVYWPMNAGLNCCSDEPISFHLCRATIMYMLEYLIYHVRPYSVVRHTRVQLPKEFFNDPPATQPTATTEKTIPTKIVTTKAAAKVEPKAANAAPAAPAPAAPAPAAPAPAAPAPAPKKQ